jgi:hypothetical protein
MKTIDEIEEDPIEFVRWARAQIAEENGCDLDRIAESLKAHEEESRAKGFKFVDLSQSRTSYSQAADAQEPSIVREDPPAQS